MSQPFIGQIILVPYNFAPQNFAFCQGQLMAIAQNDALFNLIGTTYGGDGQLTFALPDLRSRVPIGQGQGPGLSSYVIGNSGGAETTTLGPTQMPIHTHAIDVSGLTATAKCKNATGNQLTPVGNVPAADPFTPFTDDPLSAGSTVVKTQHITELRSRIDALRAGLGLSAFVYTDATLAASTTLIKAQHVVELRTALSQAYAAAGLQAPTFTDPNLAAGVTPIKAAHLNEIRTAAGGAAIYSSVSPDSVMNPAAIAIGGAITAGNAGSNQPHANLQPYLTLNYCIALFGIFPSQA